MNQTCYHQSNKPRLDPNAKFWIVVGNMPLEVMSTGNDCYERASREAERLAKNNPGVSFYVLQSVEYCVQPVNLIRNRTV